MEADSPLQRRGSAAAKRPRPLRGRAPKELEAPPALFRPSSGSGDLVLIAGGRRPDRRGSTEQGSTAPGLTDEPAELRERPDEGDRVDAETLRRAQEIAARLAVPKPPLDISARRGLGELASVPYREAAGDIDVEATLEAAAGKPVLPTDIVVRERLRTRRAVVLAVDVSGSMRGERVRTAAATVGALAGELARDDLGVLAFWSDAALLARLGEPVPPQEILRALVRIPARGLTNVGFPLELAREQLGGATDAADARVLLLSDCVHNAGPDPRSAARALPRLDVLLDTSGERDVELARALARLGRGRLALVRSHRDVASALSRIFAS